MTVIADVHEDHDATFGEVGGRRVVLEYGRPDRTHLAVRRVVGLTEPAYGIAVVEAATGTTAGDPTGPLREALAGPIPDAEGAGGYAVLPEGETIAADAYVYHAGGRLLCFTPPGRAEAVASAVQSAGGSAREATDEFAVFGIHGPEATEKVASVLHGGTPPEEPLTFSRGRLDDAGATVVRTDAPAGEEGYEVVVAADAARGAFDVLLNQGLNAAPFGYRTWETLTLEAGTPLFDPDLLELPPEAVGVETPGESGAPPDRRLVGLAPDGVPDPGATVRVDDRPVGTITRAAESPVLEEPVALAVVDADTAAGGDGGKLTVGDREELTARRADLPFVEGSDRSGRIPPG